MSTDGTPDKNLEKTTKPDKAESRLDNPDAQDARVADKKTISEIDDQNPDNWMSAEGEFAITDAEKVVASRDVTQDASTDLEDDFDKEHLTEELQAIKVKGDPDQSQLAEHIQEMRSAAKEIGASTEAIDTFAEEKFSKAKPISDEQSDQFKRGAFKSLSPDQANGTTAISPDQTNDAKSISQEQVDDSKQLPPTDQPVGGYEQENRADGGITLKGVIPGEVDNNWQSIVEKVSELPLDKQFEIIGTGLQAFNDELNRQKLEIAIGTVEGIGEGFKSLGDGVVSLANGIGQVGQFSADVMTNNPRALETSARAGDAIGKSLVSGVRLFQTSHDYLYNIGYTGDYAKPFNDIANLGEQLDKTWQKMPTRERAKLASKLSTEFLGGLAIPLGASKFAKSERFVLTLEEIATKAKDLGKGAKDKTSKFIGNFVDELTQPVAVTPDGQKIRIPKEPQKAEGLHMSKSDEPHAKPSGKHIEESRQVEKTDLVRISEGFYAELGRAYDSLPESQKQFLKMKGTKIKPVKRMTDVPGGNIKQGGGYCQNTIYLPEEIMKNGHWVENDDLMFRLRHEIGHALNEESGVISGVPNSDNPSFIQAFNEDIRNASPEKFPKLKLRMDNLQVARDEVYADTYAHVTSPSESNAAYSQLIRELFPSCYKHLSKEIKG